MSFVRGFWQGSASPESNLGFQVGLLLIGLIWLLSAELLRENHEHLLCTSGQHSHSGNVTEVFGWDQLFQGMQGLMHPCSSLLRCLIYGISAGTVLPGSEDGGCLKEKSL